MMLLVAHILIAAVNLLMPWERPLPKALAMNLS